MSRNGLYGKGVPALLNGRAYVGVCSKRGVH